MSQIDSDSAFLCDMSQIDSNLAFLCDMSQIKNTPYDARIDGELCGPKTHDIELKKVPALGHRYSRSITNWLA